MAKGVEVLLRLYWMQAQKNSREGKKEVKVRELWSAEVGM